MIEEKATPVRQTAAKFGISKSTVHKDITTRLKKLNAVLYDRVQEVLYTNKGGGTSAAAWRRGEYRTQAGAGYCAAGEKRTATLAEGWPAYLTHQINQIDSKS